MLVKVIKPNHKAINIVQWPVQNVQAISTKRISPFFSTDKNKRFLNYSYDLNNAFESFNLGDHVGDDPNVVEKNRRSLLKLLPENTKIQWLKQVHGCDVKILTEYSPNIIEADSVVTSVKNLALSIMTADCLPILLSDKNGKQVAAIHGGWKPLSLNIIAKTIQKMSISPERLYAWLGPCISEQIFEVGIEVKQIFIEQSVDFEKAFSDYNHIDNRCDGGKKYLANLQMIASIQLQQCGVKHILALPDCTYNQPEHYYSYRRDNITGRMASIICRV